MKTPREILLNRHRAAETKLDEVRERAIADACVRVTNAGQPDRFVSSVREFFRIPRLAWAGFAAAWAVIITLNLASRETASTVTLASATQPSAETLQALREQKRLFAELVGAGAPADASRPVPRPRSERKPPIAFA